MKNRERSDIGMFTPHSFHCSRSAGQAVVGESESVWLVKATLAFWNMLCYLPFPFYIPRTSLSSRKIFLFPLSFFHISIKFIFQDNSSIHKSRVVTEWLNTNHINTLPWPSKSPDLNPIENVWAQMVKDMYSRNFRPANVEELWLAIENAWENIGEDYTRTLILSMRNRLQKVINANGAWTKY